MKTRVIKKIIALTIATVTVMGMTTTGASAGWKQNNNGWWNTKGSSYSVGWENVDGSWFYFDQSGYMKTGWLQDGDKWYFLKSSGEMAHDVSIDNYTLGSDGTWVKDNVTDINATSTTGAAVVIPTDTISTTSAAVVIPTVIIPADKLNGANTNGMLHKYINQAQRLEKFEDKYNEKLDKLAEKIEKKEKK